MAAIAHAEVLMVDLVPEVERSDAIQAFVSQQTPIVRIADDDGQTGTGYSYTIGTGGRGRHPLPAWASTGTGRRSASGRLQVSQQHLERSDT